MHEEIKRRIEMPSQGLQARNVIPANWAEQPAEEFLRKERRLANAL